MADEITLSAPHETKSALVLTELAKQHQFSAWKNTPFGAESSGTVAFNTTEIPVRLEIGSSNGTPLKEGDGDRYSFRPTQGNLQIEIGKKLPETDAPRVAEALAETLTVFHTMCFRPTVRSVEPLS